MKKLLIVILVLGSNLLQARTFYRKELILETSYSQLGQRTQHFEKSELLVDFSDDLKVCEVAYKEEAEACSFNIVETYELIGDRKKTAVLVEIKLPSSLVKRILVTSLPDDMSARFRPVPFYSTLMLFDESTELSIPLYLQKLTDFFPAMTNSETLQLHSNNSNESVHLILSGDYTPTRP